jgi:hypothetical protein
MIDLFPHPEAGQTAALRVTVVRRANRIDDSYEVELPDGTVVSVPMSALTWFRARPELAEDAQRYRELVSALEFLRACPDSLKITLPAPLADYVLLARALGWKPCPGAKEEQGG